MTKPAFIAMGDIHLSFQIWNRLRDITGDSTTAFTELVTAAINRQVPLVVVGDLFDVANPHPQLVEYVRREVERMQGEGVRLYFIDGNHDKRPVPWLTAISDWPVHLDHAKYPSLEIGGLQCTGFDYDLSVTIERRLADLGSELAGHPGSADPLHIDVLFLHQAVKQGLKFDGAWNCDLDWVPAEIPLTIMGDLHAPSEHATPGGVALYTGSSHPRSVAEFGGKGYVVVNQDKTWERVPFATQRAFHHETITTTASDRIIVDLADWARVCANPSPVLWLDYTTDQTRLVAAIADAVAGANPSAIIIREEMRFRTSTDLTTGVDTSDVPSLTQLLGRVIVEAERSGAYALVKDLLDPKASPQEVIAVHRAKYLAAAS